MRKIGFPISITFLIAMLAFYVFLIDDSGSTVIVYDGEIVDSKLIGPIGRPTKGPGGVDAIELAGGKESLLLDIRVGDTVIQETTGASWPQGYKIGTRVTITESRSRLFGRCRFRIVSLTD